MSVRDFFARNAPVNADSYLATGIFLKEARYVFLADAVRFKLFVCPLACRFHCYKSRCSIVDGFLRHQSLKFSLCQAANSAHHGASLCKKKIDQLHEFPKNKKIILYFIFYDAKY